MQVPVVKAVPFSQYRLWASWYHRTKVDDKICKYELKQKEEDKDDSVVIKGKLHKE